MDFNVLVKSKTFWAGIAGLVASIGGYQTGQIDGGTAVQTGLTCLIGIFLRDGIAKK